MIDFQERSKKIVEKISSIQKTLDRLNVKTFLIDGALLGLMREGKILDWDWDCEIVFEDTNLDNAKMLEIVEELSKIGMLLININSGKYFKLNLRDKSIPNYTFSLMGLVKKNTFFLRPRYRYPVSCFRGNDKFITLHGLDLRIPSNPEDLLSFVYKDWLTPNASLNSKDYINENAIKYSSFQDIIFRVQSKLIKLSYTVIHFLLSDYLNGRETLYKAQLKQLAGCHSQILQIGSSDGKEVSIILRNAKELKTLTIIEPNSKSLLEIKKRTKKFSNRNNNVVKIIESAVVNSRFSGSSISLYYPGEKSNLGTPKNDFTESNMIRSNTTTLSRALSGFNYELPTLICMDIEGQESDLLNEACIKKFSKITILFELHQDKYSDEFFTHNIDELFKNGFEIYAVESGGFFDLDYFKNELFDKVLIAGRRSLYHIKYQDKILNNIFKKFYSLTPIPPFFSNRLARSVVMRKNTDLRPINLRQPYFFYLKLLNKIIIISLKFINNVAKIVIK